MTDTNGIAAEQLLSILERVENIEATIKAFNSDKSEIYQEAKALGFDVAALKRLVAERRMTFAERAEKEAILDLYRMEVERASRARAHARAA